MASKFLEKLESAKVTSELLSSEEMKDLIHEFEVYQSEVKVKEVELRDTVYSVRSERRTEILKIFMIAFALFLVIGLFIYAIIFDSRKEKIQSLETSSEMTKNKYESDLKRIEEEYQKRTTNIQLSREDLCLRDVRHVSQLLETLNNICK